jgi:hypothetical protein
VTATAHTSTNTNARTSKRAAADKAQPVPSQSASEEDEDIAAYERFLNEDQQADDDDDEQDEAPVPARPQKQHAGKASSRQMVVHTNQQPMPRQQWRKQTELQTQEPYETMIDLVPPDPFAGTFSVKEKQEQAVGDEEWQNQKLPWYFPKSKPRIAGTVLHIESKEEAVDYPDLYAAIATLLVELIWVMINVQQTRDTDRVVMTTVRIQTTAGELRDARLRGNMRGANLSLGDKVSLWGPRRHGVLFIRRGYNHTTQSVISTHSIGLLIPAIITILLFVALIYFSPTIFPIAKHTFLSFFSSFFSFFQQHPIVLPRQNK